MPVVSGAAATSSCDELHFGAVEIFNRGQWGRICTGNSANGLFAFQLVASVACRQLGFPFASLLPLTTDNVATFAASIAWATDVRCTGLEERLDECIFPEAPDVPASDTGAVVDDLGGYGGSVTPGKLPVQPISGQTCTTTQAERFAVVCRMFEIEGTAVMSSWHHSFKFNSSDNRAPCQLLTMLPTAAAMFAKLLPRWQRMSASTSRCTRWPPLQLS